jgi:hypothetical protein
MMKVVKCMENDFTFNKSGSGQGKHPKRKISQARGGGFKEITFFLNGIFF